MVDPVDPTPGEQTEIVCRVEQVKPVDDLEVVLMNGTTALPVGKIYYLENIDSVTTSLEMKLYLTLSRYSLIRL